MNKLMALLMTCMLLVGCTSETEFGPCIGAFDDKDVTKTYALDKGNVFVAFVLSETLIVPIYVLSYETLCPVGNK